MSLRAREPSRLVFPHGDSSTRKASEDIAGARERS